jgi:hypothetical protein
MGGHITRLYKMAAGELHIISSADDVSLPNRAETLFRAWDASGRRAGLVYSRFILIDSQSRTFDGDHGNAKAHWNAVVNAAADQPSRNSGQSAQGFKNGWLDIGTQRVRWIEHAPDLVALVGRKTDVIASGCTAASSAKLFRTFGSMSPDIVAEDQVLIFRSALAGPILFVDMPLVKYRRHGANLTTVGSPRRGPGILLQRNIAGYNQYLRDLRTAGDLGIVKQPLLRRLEREISRQLNILKTQRECLEASRLHVVNLAWKLVKFGAGPRTISRAVAGVLRRPVRALSASEGK